MLVANLDHHRTNEISMVQPAEEVNPHMTLVGFRSTPGEIPDLAYFSWATSVACANAWNTTHWIPRAPTRRQGEWTCRFGPYNFTEVCRTAQLGCAAIGIISSIVVSGGHLTPEPSPASALVFRVKQFGIEIFLSFCMPSACLNFRFYCLRAPHGPHTLESSGPRLGVINGRWDHQHAGGPHVPQLEGEGSLHYPNTSQYAHYVFNTLDQDHSGILSFEDFVTGLSILSRGSIDEKLRWTFSLYDINGDGCITREEMTDIVTAVYELMGKFADPTLDHEGVREKVDRMFQSSRGTLKIYKRWEISQTLCVALSSVSFSKEKSLENGTNYQVSPRGGGYASRPDMRPSGAACWRCLYQRYPNLTWSELS
ncbi:Kv channel-interacting protein 2 [Eufriesea mexicana]|uniref:Kv channel-interacting protein 2 n=1 Tax=Eufriesea mexicana TaxID=516756 RepID=A0A310S8P3_9HYME|nr:Kv channel-interacting protein 2 [Eufriesea mexicana]